MRFLTLLTNIVIVVAMLAACTVDGAVDASSDGGDQPTPLGESDARSESDSTEEAGPPLDQDSAPATSPAPKSVDPYDPSTWDIESDDAIIRRAFNAARSAFLERGAEAGITALADLAWPDRTADELLVCFWGGTTYAELDEEELVIDHRWENLLSDEGWEVFGKVPSDEGWRVYLADLTITTSRRFAGRSEQDVESSTAHVAVNEEDEVVWFPDC